MGTLMEKPQDLRPIAFFGDLTASSSLRRSHALLERHWLKYFQLLVVVQLYTCTSAKIDTTAINSTSG